MKRPANQVHKSRIHRWEHGNGMEACGRVKQPIKSFGGIGRRRQRATRGWTALQDVREACRTGCGARGVAVVAACIVSPPSRRWGCERMVANNNDAACGEIIL